MHTAPMTLTQLGECGYITTDGYIEGRAMRDWIRPYPTKYPDYWSQVFIRRLKSFFFAPNWSLRVAVSDDNDEFFQPSKGAETLGYAAWSRIWGTDGRPVHNVDSSAPLQWSNGSLLDGFEQWAISLHDAYFRFFRFDRGYDYEDIDFFIRSLVKTHGRLEEVLRQESPAAGWIYLEELHCHPRFQRRGIGGRLLRQGIEQATREGVPLALMASEEGEPLYTKMGFKTVGVVHYNIYTTPAMIYFPPGCEQKVKDKFVIDMNAETSS